MSLVLDDDRSVEVALMGKKWVLVVLGFGEVGGYWERKAGGDRSKAAIVERERESRIQRPVWGNISLTEY